MTGDVGASAGARCPTKFDLQVAGQALETLRPQKGSESNVNGQTDRQTDLKIIFVS